MAYTKKADCSLEKLKAIDKRYLTAAEVAPYLGMDANDVRYTAREGEFNFPVTICKTRVKIPKGDFLEWYTRNY